MLGTRYRREGKYSLLLLAMALLLSGCSYLEGLSRPGADEPVLEPQLPPTVDLESLDAPAEPEPRPPVIAEPEPDTEAPAEREDPPRVAVIISGRSAAYENVATALSSRLEAADIYDMSDKSLTANEMLDSIRHSGSEIVVAIGLRATKFAQNFDDLPVVFSQVFNASQFDDKDRPLKGVSVLPPLELQIEAWRKLNPNLSSIGAVVGHGHEHLIREASDTAEEHGLRFHYRLAQSDRETLYLFTRLVPDIDGFWLFPDNRILSASVLRQMLTYASRHQVQVAVFNDSLLALGATISTTSVDTDIADTIVTVASQLLATDGVDVPSLTPLKKIQVRTRLPTDVERLASGADTTEEGAY